MLDLNASGAGDLSLCYLSCPKEATCDPAATCCGPVSKPKEPPAASDSRSVATSIKLAQLNAQRQAASAGAPQE